MPPFRSRPRRVPRVRLSANALAGIGAVAIGIAAIAGWQGSTGTDPPAPAAQAPVDAIARLSSIPVSSHGIDYRRLDERMARLAGAADMVGMAVAIVEDGRLTFVKGYGVTTAGGDPVTPHTVFRWASLSKTVAATLTAKLASEGRFSLDDPVAKFATSLRLPDGSEARVTVADLLSHRTGIVKNAYDDKLEENIDPRAIRGMYATLAPFCPPGTCFSYQNVAFDTVSEIDRRVTGEPYAALARQDLFAPLGMTDASIGREGLVGARSWAPPHNGRRELKVEDAYYRIPAAGGVNSSILDLGQWMRAQMGEVPRVLSPALLATIHDPRVKTPRDRRATEYDRVMTDTSYGLGFRNATYDGHRLIGHRGAVAGYRSLISFDPERRTGVAVLWNSQSLRPVAIPLELFDMLYGNPPKEWMTFGGK